MTYENEIRSGRNIKQMMYRALQLARSDPAGPVYLMAAREVLEEEVPPAAIDPGNWPALEAGALPFDGVEALAGDLLGAKRPLIVTSYLGRRKKAVDELVRLAERLGIGVLESAASYTSFPANHPMYQGCQGNEPVQNSVLADADVILILDCDVPWIPLVNRPNPAAKIFHLDVDPLKERMPMWYVATKKTFRADVATALGQINEYLDGAGSIDDASAAERRAHYAALHAAVLRNDLNLVKALLAHGADPNIKMTKGTPVRRDTTDYNLLAPLIGSTPYLLAARFLEPQIMGALVAGGADPKSTMPNGATALMLAAGMGSSFEESRRGINIIDFGKVEPESQVLEAVKTAFDLSADVNAANQAGDTALHASAAWGHETVIQFLADHGAQINAKNKSGLTPLAAVSAPARRKYQLAGAAASGGDSTSEDPAQLARQRTAALLRKLGATE